MERTIQNIILLLRILIALYIIRLGIDFWISNNILMLVVIVSICCLIYCFESSIRENNLALKTKQLVWRDIKVSFSFEVPAECDYPEFITQLQKDLQDTIDQKAKEIKKEFYEKEQH